MKKKQENHNISEIWDKTHKAIYIGFERLQTESFKEELLRSTDLEKMRQLRNACDLMELMQMIKEDFKIHDLYEYKRKHRTTQKSKISAKHNTRLKKERVLDSK